LNEFFSDPAKTKKKPLEGFSPVTLFAEITEPTLKLVEVIQLNDSLIGDYKTRIGTNV
jgi:hypothetical protein